MNLLHLDCFSGLAGDMFLGACLDLGVPSSALESAVRGLGLGGLSLEVRRSSRGGLGGVRFRVLLEGRALEGPDPEEPCGPAAAATAAAGPWGGGDVPLAELRRAISDARLEQPVRSRSLALLERIAAAEAEAAGGAVAEVAWPEPAALDLVVDLVGAATAVDRLRPDRVTCGLVYVGGVGGPVGERTPVPGPTAARLLIGMPVVGGDGGELVTPTGAVLLAELVDEFRPLPPMRLARVGHGLGRAELADRPNAVRIWSGEALAERRGPRAAAAGGGP